MSVVSHRRSIYLKRKRKTTRNQARIAGVPAWVPTRHLPNTSLDFVWVGGGGGMEPSSVLFRSLLALLYEPRMTMNDDDECGAVEGMLGRGNRSTRRKPAPVPLCPRQIPHELTRARTRAAAVGSQLLTTWATVRPNLECYYSSQLARFWFWFNLEAILIRFS
jgi:hypothetical protein